MADTTPVDLEPPSAAQELADVNADIEDGSDTAVATAVAPAPLGKSWAFDWANEKFLRKPGGHSPVQTFGDDTLVEWCMHTLYTAKGAHAIYPSDYGMEQPNRWFGRYLDAAELIQMEADIHDALTYHPRIVDIINFRFTQEDDDEFVEFSCDIVKDDSSTVRLSNESVTGG